MLENMPTPPPLGAKATESQVYLYNMMHFKHHVLDDLHGFDRIALLVSSGLESWRMLNEQATNTELAYLYLKHIAIK